LGTYFSPKPVAFITPLHVFLQNTIAAAEVADVRKGRDAINKKMTLKLTARYDKTHCDQRKW